MSPGAPQWHLHIGAHKTATTHLQDTLVACAPDLARAGVHYVSRQRMLRIGLVRFLRRGQIVRNGLERLSTKSDLECMRARLLRRSRGRSHVLISEERLIGRAVDLLEGYPDLEERLLSITTLIGQDDVAIHLSIRDQSEILPSAYAQALRTHSRPQPFETLLAKWLQSPPRWTGLVARIRATLPRASLKVWTMEEYLTEPAKVVTALAGTNDIAVPKLQRPERTARFNSEALAMLEHLQPLTLSDEERRAANESVAQIEGAPYNPLDAQQKARLNDAFRRDLEEIAPEYWLLPR